MLRNKGWNQSGAFVSAGGPPTGIDRNCIDG
jgi:hypothetical protein